MDNPVSTPLTFSRGAELQFFPVQQMLSGCRKIQNQDRTAGFQVGSFALGATSPVEHLFLNSTDRSACQVALGAIRCFRWASCFSHLPVTVLPGIFACTSITTQTSNLNSKKM